jgi:hypothetical protein
MNEDPLFNDGVNVDWSSYSGGEGAMAPVAAQSPRAPAAASSSPAGPRAAAASSVQSGAPPVAADSDRRSSARASDHARRAERAAAGAARAPPPPAAAAAPPDLEEEFDLDIAGALAVEDFEPEAYVGDEYYASEAAMPALEHQPAAPPAAAPPAAAAPAAASAPAAAAAAAAAAPPAAAQGESEVLFDELSSSERKEWVPINVYEADEELFRQLEREHKETYPMCDPKLAACAMCNYIPPPGSQVEEAWKRVVGDPALLPNKAVRIAEYYMASVFPGEDERYKEAMRKWRETQQALEARRASGATEGEVADLVAQTRCEPLPALTLSAWQVVHHYRSHVLSYEDQRPLIEAQSVQLLRDALCKVKYRKRSNPKETSFSYKNMNEFFKGAYFCQRLWGSDAKRRRGQ